MEMSVWICPPIRTKPSRGEAILWNKTGPILGQEMDSGQLQSNNCLPTRRLVENTHAGFKAHLTEGECRNVKPWHFCF